MSEIEVHDEFICTCGDHKKAKAEELWHEVNEKLGNGPADDFVTRVVFSLHWDFRVRVVDILCDQWFLLIAENRDKTFRTHIQCDRLEDGFAATWRAVAARFPSTGEFYVQDAVVDSST